MNFHPMTIRAMKSICGSFNFHTVDLHIKSEQHGELDKFGTTQRSALKSSSWLSLPKKACLRGHWYWRALQNGSPLLFQGTKTKNSEGGPGHLWNSLCVSGKKHFSKSFFNFWFQLTPGPSGFGCSVHCLHYLPFSDHLPTRYQISLPRSFIFLTGICHGKQLSIEKSK